MSTYIPRQVKPIRERVEVKLDRELVVELERYCEYLESDRDYVIAQALSVAFRKDRGFAEWLVTRPAPKPVSGSEAEQVTPRSKS